MRDILVTGGNGQLGTELKRYAWPAGWRVVAIDIDELDLTDTSAIAAMHLRAGPKVSANQ